MIRISLIIPALNEADRIAAQVKQLRRRESGGIGEVIVVDGGSTDETVSEAGRAGARVLESDRKGRAAQMNFGADRARFPVLYFIHADTLPPDGYDRMITRAVEEGYRAGCFRLAFDWDHPLLNFYGWCTRFDLNAFRFGDQSLFVTKALFDSIGGYDSELIVMEDNVIVRRIKREEPFIIIPEEVVTSARKYRGNGTVKLQLIFTLIYVLFFLGVPQKKLVRIYRKLVS